MTGSRNTAQSSTSTSSTARASSWSGRIIGVTCLVVIVGSVFWLGHFYSGWFDSKASAAESTPAPTVTDEPKKGSPTPDEEPVVESKDEAPTFMTRDERVKKALAEHEENLKRIESLGVAEIESGDDDVVMEEAMKRTKARALADHLLYLDGKETSEEIREKRLQLQEAGLGNLIVDVKRNRQDINRNQSQIKKNTDAIDELKKRVGNLESKDVEVDRRFIEPAGEPTSADECVNIEVQVIETGKTQRHEDVYTRVVEGRRFYWVPSPSRGWFWFYPPNAGCRVTYW